MLGAAWECYYLELHDNKDMADKRKKERKKEKLYLKS